LNYCKLQLKCSRVSPSNRTRRARPIYGHPRSPCLLIQILFIFQPRWVRRRFLRLEIALHCSLSPCSFPFQLVHAAFISTVWVVVVVVIVCVFFFFGSGWHFEESRQGKWTFVIARIIFWVQQQFLNVAWRFECFVDDFLIFFLVWVCSLWISAAFITGAPFSSTVA